MKHFFKFIFLSFFLISSSHTKERSEEEIKIGVFLEDLKEIGQFKEIKKVPIQSQIP